MAVALAVAAFVLSVTMGAKAVRAGGTGGAIDTWAQATLNNGAASSRPAAAPIAGRSATGRTIPTTAPPRTGGSGRRPAGEVSSPHAAPRAAAGGFTDTSSRDWVGAWGAAVEQAGYPPADNQSFRLIVHPTIGGRALRVRLSNTFGTVPLTLASLSVAVRTTGPTVDAATSRPLTFAGRPGVTIPPGGMAVSDPVGFTFRFGQDLAVSFYVPGATGPVTGHGSAVSIVTDYLTPPGAGDVTRDASGSSFTLTTRNEYFLSGLDAYVPDAEGTVIAFGDSITDGADSGVDRYHDWPDLLAGRLNGAGRRLGVVNEGISGNTVLPCSTFIAIGDAAVVRFDRDVLQWPNVRAIILMEGGNDFRLCPATPSDVEAGLQTLVRRAQRAGIRVVLGTYPPRVSKTLIRPSGPPDPLGENERRALNAWIRAQTGKVAAVIDWDATLRDPRHPGRQNPASHSPDGVHPGPPGYKVMADAVPLARL